MDAGADGAMIKAAQKDLDGAIADYNKAIELNSTNPRAYNNRGVTQFDKGDWDGALSDYNRAIELDSTFYAPYAESRHRQE
jgi:tetratricopeptide (TPR) repeat protein